jgi:hypothetical protein
MVYNIQNYSVFGLFPFNLSVFSYYLSYIMYNDLQRRNKSNQIEVIAINKTGIVHPVHFPCKCYDFQDH